MNRKLSIFCCLWIAIAFILQPLTGLASTSSSTKQCQEYQIPVSLAEGKAASYQIYGELCSRGSMEGKTVQVLVHGLTLTHDYWDLPYQPEKYSYVDHLTKEGYVTFSIDRIGVGQSDKPPALNITVKSNAHVVHQVIQKLRSGAIGGTPFSNVILVGHSLGSIIAYKEVSMYHDVDGLIISGFLRPFDPLGGVDMLTSIFPAQTDPMFKDQNVPLGYITLPKNKRKIFYHADMMDPKIYDIDNQTKGTGTDAEVATLLSKFIINDSRNIKVPVLLAIGDKDRLFCSAVVTCKSAEAIIKRERIYFPKETNIEGFVLSNTGHNINYHTNATSFFQTAADWSDRHIGTKK